MSARANMLPIHAMILFIVVINSLYSCSVTTDQPGQWPGTASETKPWTRWWWHGSAVTKEGITAELEAYSRAGLGGVEITPIYGVHGHEDKFIPYLSPQWIEMFKHTLSEAKRLGLGVDIATGTGWPFGGPWVEDEFASRNVFHKVYTLEGGKSLSEKISFTQPPFLRAVGSQVYEVHDNAEAEGRKTQGSRKEPLLKYDPANIKIENINRPVSSNDDLQSLALDQVQFEQDIPLVALTAYGSNGESVDLLEFVNGNGTLNWIAPAGKWELYAVFQGWHGKMVERAAPGGEGNVIDHFSTDALNDYLAKFDSAFRGVDLGALRGFFNDSYEVDDARGAADWTPALLNEFTKRRGYSLTDHLPALFGNDDPEKNDRVLYDYRLTIGELLLENFTRPWTEWAHRRNKIVRNQAHGAPSNILDLYSTVDIPETEGVEPLRIKMATSAGHVSGKKLISSESATWLDEHFLSNLGDVKANVDRYLVNGVNHILYHGTSYSPPGEEWPGWLFYAAVHLNPRNPQWTDFAALNRYLARCQSYLQQGKPWNDVLLYYPIADRLSARGPEMVEHFDNPMVNFKESSFLKTAEQLLQSGYSFDFISDTQLAGVKFTDGKLTATGSSDYRALIIPRCKYIPVETLATLARLAKEGAEIIFVESLPQTFAGWDNGKSEKFNSLVEEMRPVTTYDAETLGSGLADAGIHPEAMAKEGLTFTRRVMSDERTVYFISNPTTVSFEGWLALNASPPASGQAGRSAVILDPMTSTSGLAKLKNDNTVFVRLVPGQSLLIELKANETPLPQFLYTRSTSESVELKNWTLEFVDGGPVLPQSVRMDTLSPWTSLSGDGYRVFAGIATYSTTFDRPGKESFAWTLRFGNIDESATIFLNGDSLATIIGQPFEIIIDNAKVKDIGNELVIRVSNLMANRIADLDRRGVPWKKFYNVNFPSRKPENRVNGLFNSSAWQPAPSGLTGPVSISPVSPY
jgi:hypothetical protein